VFCNVTTQLGDLHFSCQFSFEATEHNFTLAGLESVANAGNRSCAVSNRKQNQLFVNEVSVAQQFYIVIYKSRRRVVGGKPVFALVCKLSSESKLDLVVVVLVEVFKVNFVVFNVLEVLLAFLGC